MSNAGEVCPSIGAATSPTKVWPSVVVTVNAVRIAGNTVLGRIGCDITFSLKILWSAMQSFTPTDGMPVTS